MVPLLLIWSRLLGYFSCCPETFAVIIIATLSVLLRSLPIDLCAGVCIALDGTLTMNRSFIASVYCDISEQPAICDCESTETETFTMIALEKRPSILPSIRSSLWRDGLMASEPESNLKIKCFMLPKHRRISEAVRATMQSEQVSFHWVVEYPFL